MKILKTRLKSKINIRTEQDFPVKGVEFIDINPLIFDKDTFKEITNKFAKEVKKKKADYILCPEARGFLFGTAAGYKANVPCIPIRKKGKLPPSTVLKDISYGKQYGLDHMELPSLYNDDYNGKNFYIIDDIYATGNTIRAICEVVESLGGKIAGIGVVINIKELNKDKKIYSLIDINEG